MAPMNENMVFIRNLVTESFNQNFLVKTEPYRVLRKVSTLKDSQIKPAFFGVETCPILIFLHFAYYHYEIPYASH